jgi:hypothetical protein
LEQQQFSANIAGTLKPWLEHRGRERVSRMFDIRNRQLA